MRSAGIKVALFVLLFAIGSRVEAASYRGNTQSKAFHQESCRYYSCKHCTVHFSSTEEAASRGYRPCGTCRPTDSSARSAHGAAHYAGNTSTRKFHASSCRYFDCKNCTAKFSSRDEAIDAGYAPGGCCRP